MSRPKRVKHNPILGDLDEFLEDNMGLVHSICNRYRSRLAMLRIEYDDLVNLGVIGFMKAYERFDPSKFLTDVGKGVQFSTYAYPMINGEIMRFVRDHNVGARFSRTDKDVGRKIMAMKLYGKSKEYIAEEFGVTLARAEGGILWIDHQQADSMDKVIHSDGDSPITIQDQLSVEEEDKTVIIVEEFLNSIPDRHRTIVQMTLNNHTQNEIGKELGVSQVQVSRLMRQVRAMYNNYAKGLPVENKIRRRRSKMENKEKNEEAKRLIRETNKGPTEIANITGANVNSVRTWSSKLRSKSSKSKKPKKSAAEKSKGKSNTNTQDKAKEVSSTVVNQSNGDVFMSMSGDCDSREEMMRKFSKLLEMLTVQEIEKFNFSIKIYNR